MVVCCGMWYHTGTVIMQIDFLKVFFSLFCQFSDEFSNFHPLDTSYYLTDA